MLYERTARFMYENSITYYINYFKQPVLDFKKFHSNPLFFVKVGFTIL